VSGRHSAHGLALLAQSNGHNGRTGPSRQHSAAASDTLAARPVLGLHGEHQGYVVQACGGGSSPEQHGNGEQWGWLSTAVLFDGGVAPMNGGDRSCSTRASSRS
jgi:hypothetical protein